MRWLGECVYPLSLRVIGKVRGSGEGRDEERGYIYRERGRNKVKGMEEVIGCRGTEGGS